MPRPYPVSSLRSAFIGLLCALLWLSGARAQRVDVKAVTAELEPAIAQAMREGRIPSCSVALVAAEGVVWKKAFGLSNLWAKTQATTETIYLIGSTYKTLSTAALLQLFEGGAFKLDDPVHDYLDDLEIQSEDPEHPVTFRHLLTHTSGIPGGYGRHLVWGDTVPKPIKEYLSKSLVVQTPPLRRVVYSNVAYTLVAHLIEKLSGIPYRRYMQRKIFDPLEMKDTVFIPTPAIDERLAVPYLITEEGELAPAERTKADVWPAGLVYGSIQDQANWLIANLQGGRFGKNRILQPQTVAQTFVRQYESFAGTMHAGWGNETAGFGLTWWTARKDGDRHFAHSGSVSGFTAFLEGNADEGIGFAILTNGHRAHPHLVRLADLSLRLMKSHRVGESQPGH